MNTIKPDGQHGEAVESIITVAGQMFQDYSRGTALIDGYWAEGWDCADPWGSTLDAWFALEYACQACGIANSEHFSSPYTTGDPDKGFLYVQICDAIVEDRVDKDDIVFARRLFEIMTCAFKLAGLDY